MTPAQPEGIRDARAADETLNPLLRHLNNTGSRFPENAFRRRYQNMTSYIPRRPLLSRHRDKFRSSTGPPFRKERQRRQEAQANQDRS
jgi:hypothetical protein